MKSCMEGRGPSTRRLNHFIFINTADIMVAGREEWLFSKEVPGMMQ